jgi:hypothetical protein
MTFFSQDMSVEFATDPKIDSNMFFAVRLPTSKGDNGKSFVAAMCCDGKGTNVTKLFPVACGGDRPRELSPPSLVI